MGNRTVERQKWLDDVRQSGTAGGEPRGWNAVTVNQGKKALKRKENKQFNYWLSEVGKLDGLDNYDLQHVCPEAQTVPPASPWAQRSTATGSTDKNISQVSKYSTECVLSLTTRLVPNDAVGKLFPAKPFKEEDRKRKETEKEERTLMADRKGTKGK